MLLKELIKELNSVSVYGNTDVEIKEIKTDSNSITKGSLFICLKGVGYDGHDYIRQVETYGAAAVITERKLDTPLVQVVVKSARIAMSVVASEFYNHPDKKMKIIGVLGTNGKTTTAHLITSVLTGAGIKCGLIGTLGVFYGDKYFEPTLTTPDPLEMYKILADMQDCGVEAVITEVSAHAVYWDKVFGIKFEVAVFTNFTQDHLDFFGDMESYKRAKLKFFKENEIKFVVTNSDDVVGLEIAETVEKSVTYGIDNPADVFAIDIEETDDGEKFVVNLFDTIYDVNLNLIGRFNVYNALASATASALFGVTLDKIIEGLENLKGVSGRLEKIYDGDFKIYIDYAHTPDGLTKSLTSLKPICKGKLVSVFGCGGNRDKSKREIMGRISGEYADFTVITTDNPRYEEPMDIIWEIEKGVAEVTKNYVLIQDREEGIKYAVEYARSGDVILIAGKGSEKYQEVFGIKKPYNDKDTVWELTKKWKS